jgi:predicted aldo/keto reductase-like oxidoreductase
MGCMRFPSTLGAVDHRKAEALTGKAVESGINYFDTAWMYPGNEDALGRALENLALRDRVYLATKLPVALIKQRKDFDRFFDEELKRLRTDHVDYYLMHMLTGTASWRRLSDLGIADWIRMKKENGAVRQAGFSFHGSRDAFLKLLDVYDWDFCQIQYNYSDENFQAGVTGLKAAAARGMPVIIMEPLLGGRLAGNLPAAARAIFAAAKLHGPDGSARRAAPAAWGLRWVFNHGEATVVLSGMNTIAQIEENAAVADAAEAGSLTPEELSVYGKVRDVFNAAYKIRCTGCGYCLPCPRGVNIPGCFSACNISYVMGRAAGWQQYATSAAFTSRAHGGPSLCTACGRCEQRCPQKLPVVQHLREVRRRMEPFWFRLIIAGVRRFLGYHRPLPGNAA